LVDALAKRMFMQVHTYLVDQLTAARVTPYSCLASL
jgi:hypothetical protein